MGLIEKQVRKHANQKLAAPMVAFAAMTIPEVVTGVKKVCDNFNARIDQTLASQEAGRAKPRKFTSAPVPTLTHLHVQVTQKAILIGWSRTPEWIAAQAKKKQPREGWWLASVTFPSNVPNVPEGQIAVELKLLRWLIDGDSGKLKNKARYDNLADMLAAVLKAGAGRPSTESSHQG